MNHTPQKLPPPQVVEKAIKFSHGFDPIDLEMQDLDGLYAQTRRNDVAITKA